MQYFKFFELSFDILDARPLTVVYSIQIEYMMRNSGAQRLSLKRHEHTFARIFRFIFTRNHDAVIRRSRFLSVPVACQILSQKYKE